MDARQLRHQGLVADAFPEPQTIAATWVSNKGWGTRPVRWVEDFHILPAA